MATIFSNKSSVQFSLNLYGYVPVTWMNCNSTTVCRCVLDDGRSKRAVHFCYVDTSQICTGPVQLPVIDRHNLHINNHISLPYLIN